MAAVGADQYVLGNGVAYGAHGRSSGKSPATVKVGEELTEMLGLSARLMSLAPDEVLVEEGPVATEVFFLRRVAWRQRHVGQRVR